MSAQFLNYIDPELDIIGLTTPSDTKTQTLETSCLGDETASGTGDSVGAPGGTGSNEQTLDDAGASFTAADVGRFITISGAGTGGNNGTFLIIAQNSGTQIVIKNAGGAAETSAFTWTINEPWYLSAEINHIHTDRRLIKGTANYTDAIPVYERPTAVGTDVDKNLTNLLSLDSKAIVCTRKFENQSVAATDTEVTVTDTGNLPHADATDRTGVPIQDGADAANLDSCYVDIIDPSTGVALTVDGRATGQIDCDASASAVLPADGETVVLDDGTNPAVTFEFDTNSSVTESATLRQVDISGASDEDDVRDALITAINAAPTLTINATPGGAGLVDLLNTVGGTAGNVAITDTVTDANFTVTGMTGGLATTGQRIYGFTQAGSATAPNEVEVAFYSVPIGDPISTANAYTWEDSQPTTVDIFYPYRERLDLADENCWRTTLVNGIVGDAGTAQGVADLRTVVGVGAGDTDLNGCLTNLGNFFPFSDLPDATPSVCEALNTLNEQIGDRTYTGTILTSGETVTASLQALSDAIGGSSVTRVIERLSSAVPKNTAHTLPGGNTYTVDATNNGGNMWVFWRKQLQDPGPQVDDNDYEETSTTQITPYNQIKNGDHINYFILQ